MRLRVGIIGAGVMGADHARTLATIDGAELAGVYDPRVSGPHAVSSAAALIDAADAVIVASPDDTHAEYVLACLAAGKRVLCEKPLATSAADALRLARADPAGLVQVGFMRRYDPGYVELKRCVDAGGLGTPLLVHCVHRNASAPPAFDSEAQLLSSATHEIDAVRWLLDDEFAEVTVHTRPGHGPQFLVLRTRGGVLVDVEVFVHARYGYDVRCEVVGESATAALRQPAGATVWRDWRDRFAEAYRAELRHWIDGGPGPTAWDGYVATAVAEACVTALHSGARTTVSLASR